MNIRSITYGYHYVNGQIQTHPIEAKTVESIFAKYCAGETLSEIAVSLTDQKIEYLPERYVWNKSRVKRVLDNHQYLGSEGFPQIISKAQFLAAKNRKTERNRNRNPVDEEVKLFKALTICHHCSALLTRRVDSRFDEPVSWKCPHCGCSSRISDYQFKDKIYALQQQIASDPTLIQLGTEPMEYYSIESKRLTNEIHRQLDSEKFSEDELIKMVLRCAAENYKAITGAQHITDRLTATFAQAGSLSSFNRQLFTQTVKYIRLTRSGEVLLQLQSGKIIGEDDA